MKKQAFDRFKSDLGKTFIGLTAFFAMASSEKPQAQAAVSDPVLVVQNMVVELSTASPLDLVLQETPLPDTTFAHQTEISRSFQRQSALLTSTDPKDIAAVETYRLWLRQFDTIAGKPLLQQLEDVNKIVNQGMDFSKTDKQIYGVDDYTPAIARIVAQKKIYGDCEDAVLQKYDALLRCGVDKRRLAILLVATSNTGYQTVDHAVLAVDTTRYHSMRNCLILDSAQDAREIACVNEKDMEVMYSVRPDKGLQLAKPAALKPRK